MTVRAVLSSVFAVVVPVAMFASEAETEIIYTRADVGTATAGEVEFCRAYTARLSLPEAECEGDRFTCVEDRVYGQAYSLAFFGERVSRQQDGKTTSDRVDRGRLLVALGLSPEGEDILESALEAHLEGLSATAYSRPLAGMRYMRGPFSQQALRQSSLPAWICNELDGECYCDLVVSEDERFERSYSVTGESADLACRAIENAVADIPAEVFRTMPDVRAQVRHTVLLQSVSTFSGLTWANRLASIPDGVTFEKRVLDGERTGGIRDRKDGMFRGHEGRYNDVERDVLIPAAALDLVEAPMWVTRWSFEAVGETFGTQSDLAHESSVSIVIAVIPVTDPLMEELAAVRTALHAPEKRLIEKAISRLEQASVLAPSLVVAAFADAEIWPSQGDWMVVSCRDDGSARYGIAPFPSAAEVTNPREACAAIVREIGETVGEELR